MTDHDNRIANDAAGAHSLHGVVRARHLRADWGMTACGRDGWVGHPWSSWESSDSLQSTSNRRNVTCKACLKTKRSNGELSDRASKTNKDRTAT